MRLGLFVSLGATAALGLGAVFVAAKILPNQAAARASGLVQPAQQGMPVVVATKALKYGDKLEPSELTIAHLPREAVPQGAFTTVAAVLMQDHGGAPVALTPIAAHEPILPAKLSGPGARPSVAAEVATGLRAYTIRVNDVSGVGGHALPGDRVDVVLSRDLTPTGPTRNLVSEVVLQDVRLLAVDLNADPTSNKPATPATATLEVSVDGSQRLAVAADLGKLSLALRRTGDADPIQRVAAAAPAAHFRAPGTTRRARTPSSGGLIEIVQGARRSGGGSNPPPAPAPALPPAMAAQPAKT